MKFKNQNLNILVLVVVSLLVLAIFAFPAAQNDLSRFMGLSANFQSSSSLVVSGDKFEQAEVKKVVDGDTINLTDGRTIRYLNMDTPETKKPNTAVQCYGPEASKLNKELVDGKKVWLLSDKQDKDRFGRSLRFVFISDNKPTNVGDSVNAAFVREGFARSSIYKPNTTYEDVFKKLELEAKSKKLGLWGVCSKPFVE